MPVHLVEPAIKKIIRHCHIYSGHLVFRLHTLKGCVLATKTNTDKSNGNTTYQTPEPLFRGSWNR